MVTKLEDQVLIMKYLNDKIDCDFTNIKSDTNKRYYEFSEIKSDINEINIFTQIMSQKHHYSPLNTDSLKYQDPDSVLHNNNKYLPLEGGNYMKNGDMWNIKHDINSPK